MQKRSVSGSSSAAASGSAVDAMTALTAAVQDLQAAMSALAGLLQQNGALSNGTTALPDQASGADRSSMSYKSYSTPQEAAEAQRTAFEDKTIREFDIPKARLRGALDRAEMQGPGDWATGRRGESLAALEAQRAALDERERQRLLRHSEQLRDAGELSAQDELELTEETERLATDETKAAASIAHGVQMQDYLPAFSANRPAGFWEADWTTGRGGAREEGTREEGRVDAADAVAYSRIGNPVDNVSTERLAEAIGRLADAILNGGGRSGSALHPGEAQGGLNGLLQSAKVSARPDGYN